MGPLALCLFPNRAWFVKRSSCIVATSHLLHAPRSNLTHACCASYHRFRIRLLFVLVSPCPVGCGSLLVRPDTATRHGLPFRRRSISLIMPCHVKPPRDWRENDGPVLDQVEHDMQPYRHHCRPGPRKIGECRSCMRPHYY